MADDDLQALLEAARWAPSPGNRQAFRLWVVTQTALLESMAETVGRAAQAACRGLRDDLKADAQAYLANFTFFSQAPVVVVPLYRAGADLLGAERSEADALSAVAAATQNLLLAAHAQGLGACWMTGPLLTERELAALLEVPAGWRIAALVPVGHPAERPEPPARRALARTVRRID